MLFPALSVLIFSEALGLSSLSDSWAVLERPALSWSRRLVSSAR